MRYAQAILPMNTSNLWTIPGNSPALGRWLESSRNSLDFHVSPVGTSPCLPLPTGILTSLQPSLDHLRGAGWEGTAVMGRSAKRWKAPRVIPSPKPLPTGRKLAFLETCEQMSDGSNLSSNKFVFLSSLLFSLWKSIPTPHLFSPYFHSTIWKSGVTHP